MSLLLGVLLAVVGAIIAVSEHPTQTINAAGDLQSKGSDDGFALGLSLLGLGYSLAMVAIVAIGVVLGNRVFRE